MSLTVDHYRQAVEIARSGGTPDHPYDQRQWGSPECGSPCCIHGHACLLAGVPVKPIDTPITAGVGLVCWQLDAHLALRLASVPGLLQAETDAECVRSCSDAGWDDDCIVSACCAAGWGDDRIVSACSVAGWSAARIVSVCDSAGWSAARIVEAMKG